MVTFIWVLLVIAIGCIIFEEQLHLDKAKSTLFLGGLAWICIFLRAYSYYQVHHAFEEQLLEVAELWLFLISAMSIVSILEKRHFLENLFLQVLPGEVLTEKKLLFFMGIGIFFLSAVADNVTATIIGISILVSLDIVKESKISISNSLVYAANAGGVALITGDVTTLMLEQAGMIHQKDAIFLIIPSFISTSLLFFLNSRKLSGIVKLNKKNIQTTRIDKIIAVLFLLTIVGVVIGHVSLHIPPVLSFLFGLSVIWIVSWIHKAKTGEDIKVLGYIREIEFEALFFFLGILMLVGALKYVGGLIPVTKLFDILPNYVAIFIVGILSAFFDNVPLTAVLIKANPTLNEAEWLTLTYSVGVGGSLLIFGSAAGVVAMAKYKELSVRATLPYIGNTFASMSVGFGLSAIIANIVT